MKPENAIEVREVTKNFKIFIDKGNTFKERALFRKRRKYEQRKVLKGISFDVKKGEAIGLVGHNGCGKSTTLKLLTRIIYPDTGSVEIKGRVSSLIELGAGFHPDLSGRENIYINASIFGLNRKEIDKRLDDIIAFSELKDYIDNPVRTYSSGMYMRLAFSVAINVDADVLLIDEILAVGDANFQAKCFNKLQEIKAKGTTIVIVSHSLGQIEQICERSIWIHDGVIRAEGTPREVHPMYLDYMGQKRQEIAEEEAERQAQKKAEQEAQERQKQEQQKQQEEQQEVQSAEEPVAEEPVEDEVSTIKRWGNGKARITETELLDSKRKQRSVFETGEDIIIKIKYHVKDTVEDAVFGIGFFRADGVYCYGSNTRLDRLSEFALTKDGEVEVKLNQVMLMPGRYSLDLAIESQIGIPVDYYKDVLSFEMYSKNEDVGLVRINHEWNIQ
ncbi:MAG: ABC transporter ATP-binding protein [Lachnospiraceae bacterium]|nr:ABC transporter ATP-binding protein [Lachnospiraceae bacterium]